MVDGWIVVGCIGVDEVLLGDSWLGEIGEVLC